MYEIFLKTLPFFALIGVGYISGVTRFFTEEATAYLTKFVFYFALSAMLFRFSSNLSLGDLFDWNFVFAYLLGSVVVYLLAGCVALYRRVSITETAIEAQCSIIGNVGFLGIPMLALLMGEAAVGYVMMVLAIDLLVFWIHRRHGHRWNPRSTDEFGDHPCFDHGVVEKSDDPFDCGGAVVGCVFIANPATRK